ncbi:MAG: acetoacetyl-CoA reductase [Pseudomonadota bacterium]|nr:acetoacetyl-CoA reductase [Pseudomonadota bacterium]
MVDSKRIAVVTGGMGGLGEALCRRLADDHFSVVALHSPGNPKVDAWLAAQRADGYEFGHAEVDVSRFDSCAAAGVQVRQQYGPVSVLVNNAGITRDASFRKMTAESWDLVLRTNLDSVFNMTKQVIEDMLTLGWGRIVNISSVNGQRGAFGQANYAASKAGMHGFTKSLALEFAKKGITVNTVSPGYLRTPMVTKMPPDVLEQRILPEIPLGRLGEPAEVAELVAYLASERACFVTGANLSINGGQHMF